MTDYAAQGKTRPNNVVDLGHCKNHQSYYTALSRSASAAGTMLVQAFSAKKITGGISGYLRQEFRELEILNTITKKAYEGRLPESVKGRLRNVIIRAYQRSSDYLKEGDQEWHPAIRWRPQETQVQEAGQDGFWSETLNSTMAVSSIEQTKKTKNMIPLKLTMSNPSKKGKEKEKNTAQFPQPKKMKCSSHSAVGIGPLGLKWDSRNYSCGYDSLFTILYNIWSDDVSSASRDISSCSNFMDILCDKFREMERGSLTFENARDHVRSILHNHNAKVFPMGHAGLVVSSLIKRIMGSTTYGSVVSVCDICRHVLSVSLQGRHTLIPDDDEETNNVACLLGAEGAPRVTCRKCSSVASVTRNAYLDDIPPIIAFETNASPSIQVQLSHNSGSRTYKLRGLIYYEDFHFVSRIVDNSGQVWFHDGITTKSYCEWERTINLSSETQWMRTADSRDLIYCIYALSE
ncbi:hypothetical protein M413DRAFT_72469 [Hebeloma cylindrosporum]|uniref:Uncharacterized protein n=1 Tax=Hebeloma cylindrosporum TaxID=76867 RepID=A0A0C2YIE7_HEBCY|nr:hypothetical protein M413DRAFT_72469 [Hebeloma cylindrosporum h7]